MFVPFSHVIMEDDDTKSQQPAAKAARKRPRSPESSFIKNNVSAAVKNNDNNARKDDNEEEEQQLLLLAPHTLRLLKLVEEGSVEHAQLAAVQLSEITAGSSSPVVLWDILGRLQGYLTSPNWKTRQNASIAMEGVARQLPVADQREFLEHTAVFHRDKNNIDNNNMKKKKNEETSSIGMSSTADRHAWLTLADLNENLMGTILKKGRILLSSSEAKYDDQLEEDALGQLDASASSSKGAGDGADFVSRRVQLQRQILARRLGLSTILSQVSGRDVETVLSENDLLPCLPSQSPLSTTPPPEKKTKGSSSRDVNKADTLGGRGASSSSSKSIRGLLVMEIQQQQESSSRQHGSFHRAIQHSNAQRLLATELVFRMFDSSWYIRHGSLMGILALMRAWKVHEKVQFGSWPHDIMSRCLCVLALDRFADYSETATSSETGGIVAPVREMAGQVFSVLFRTAPESFQRSACEVLVSLTKQRDEEGEGEEESEDWEIRYAALLTLKYVSALQANLQSPDGSAPIIEWSKLFVNSALKAATAGLGDTSDDVRGVAAQVLVTLFSSHEIAETHKQTPLIAEIVTCLWDALSPRILISSSVKDLVSLLSVLICMDFSLFVNSIALGKPNENPCKLLLSKLQMLTTCPYLSVRTAVVVLIGTVSKRLEVYILKATIKSDDESRDCILATAFCGVVRTVWGLYFERPSSLDVGSRDVDLFVKACEETWLNLSNASTVILRGGEGKRLELERYMILDYFGLLPGTSPTNLDNAAVTECSFGQRHRFWLDIADALSVLLAAPNCSENNTSHEVLELCLCICLDSPFVSNCERACFLFASLCRFRRNPPISSVLERSKDRLLKLVLEQPQCLSIDRQSLHDSRTSLLKVFISSFECGIEILSKGGENVDTAVRSVSMLWKKAASSHLVDPTSVAVSLDSMRLSTVSAGALLAGGASFIPTKLTPIVRSLMTSIQNELDPDCRGTACQHMVALLAILSGPAPAPRQEAFQKTRSKIIQNLCRLIKSDTEPVSVVASRVIAETVSNAGSPLQSYPAIWETISKLVEPKLVSDQILFEGLLLLDAVCAGLRSHNDTTAFVTGTFLASVATLCCTSSHVLTRNRAAKCVETMAAASQTLALETVLPTIASMCTTEDDSTRDRACSLLLVMISGPTLPLCPYVRSMLPLAMQLMTDASEPCAKTAARIFSKLVQLAPLVKTSIALRLFPDSWDEKADQVMDHLIHGKPLPPCEIYPIVNEALKASGVSLRPYQLEGVAWLRFLQLVRLNGALTDSMGLGKTLQALIGIALAHADSKNGSSLKSIVVCPSSVLGHWMKEVGRFFPGTNVFRPFCLRGSNHKTEEPSNCNLIITSYSVLRSEISHLCATKWRYCVLDEGHLLKNPKTATAKAARKLQAQHKLILTGTPVQNKVNEVWATFDFLMPNFLGSSSDFSKDFARPISKSQSPGASASDIALGMEKLKLLHQQVLPFILRREKEHVLKELPPKIITSIPCEMSPRQHQLYQDFCSSSQGERSIGAFNRALQEPSTDDVLPSLGSDILKALLYLRLVCTHPALVDSNGISIGDLASSGKLIALKEILMETGMQCQDMAGADNDSSLIYIDAADDCDDSSGKDCLEGVLDPDSNDGTISSSLLSYRYSTTPVGSKCLIFAQFTHSLDVVEEFLCQHFPGTQYLRLDGKVPTEKRGAVVDSFNGDDSVKILLLTTRIGGLGLNLTGADTVIFLEHDWNPHADLQAMDRAHRIGQEKTVNVYKLVTTDSIEEKIMKLHETKLAMSNAIVNSENSTLYSMGTDQLLDIFRFRSENSDSKSMDNVESNLDILVERYEDEYASLSVGDFIKTFKGNKETNET